MLAYLFAGEHNFLLLDEPTNHLDGDCKEIVKAYLQKKNGFILVSHDRDVLDACIDHVFEKRIEEYSEGQKKKVEIARSLCEKAHLYIWDEPMNYMDVFSRMQVEKVLQQYKPTMFLVEHDKTFVEKIATKKLLL